VDETPRSKLKSLPAVEAQGMLQPILRLYAWSLSSGARETRSIVTSRAWRWGRTPSMVSAIDEQAGQRASKLGPNMAW
jgi:hypothetical protein